MLHFSFFKWQSNTSETVDAIGMVLYFCLYYLGSMWDQDLSTLLYL